jgi:hypothetical protein
MFSGLVSSKTKPQYEEYENHGRKKKRSINFWFWSSKNFDFVTMVLDFESLRWKEIYIYTSYTKLSPNENTNMFSFLNSIRKCTFPGLLLGIIPRRERRLTKFIHQELLNELSSNENLSLFSFLNSFRKWSFFGLVLGIITRRERRLTKFIHQESLNELSSNESMTMFSFFNSIGKWSFFGLVLGPILREERRLTRFIHQESLN